MGLLRQLIECILILNQHLLGGGDCSWSMVTFSLELVAPLARKVVRRWVDEWTDLLVLQWKGKD